MNAVERYQAALIFTRKMQEAAASLDWDKLAELEARRAPLLSEIPPLSAGDRARLEKLLREIIDLDADIRERLESWHKATGELLSHLVPIP